MIVIYEFYHFFIWHGLSKYDQWFNFCLYLWKQNFGFLQVAQSFESRYKEGCLDTRGGISSHESPSDTWEQMG